MYSTMYNTVVISNKDFKLEKETKDNLKDIDTPDHYNFGKIQPIEVIEDWDLGGHLANVVKYIGRLGKKENNSKLKDLRKAKWYLDRKISFEEKKTFRKILNSLDDTINKEMWE